MLTDIKSDAFFRMCFMLGYYLQGLALVDVLSLKVAQVKQRKTTGESMYVIETCRRKTGKGVKIVIPESHTNRHRLFTLVYESAVNSKREHILPVMDSLGDDEHYIYNKVATIHVVTPLPRSTFKIPMPTSRNWPLLWAATQNISTPTSAR